MGNEALRSSRHTASSSSFRRSTRRGSKSGQNYIAEDEVDSSGAATRSGAGMEICATTVPKPARRLDKIRRSLSFRRKKKSKTPAATSSGGDLAHQSGGGGGANMTTSISAPLTINNVTNGQPAAILPASASITHETTATATGTGTVAKAIKSASTSQVTETAAASGGGASKPLLWIEDEKRVRANNCAFQVKYLGSQEVADSRGMHICEQAIERLLVDKKKPIKAILYVSGDSLRVVDELNKTLLVDQTIEKVSFCAPDRHHENGFAYICRDGTTRRWLCHGFMACKDTLKGTAVGSSGGERLSHAVGCAFSVCLEKKQKRERENVSMEVGPNHSFTRLGSFRQASLTERLEDPQIVMPAAQPVPIRPVDNPHAIERPKPSTDTFSRQNPLRATGALQLPASFKRNTAAYSSLKPGELPSFQQQKSGFNLTMNGGGSGSTTPTSAAASTKTSMLLQQHQLNQQQQHQGTVDTTLTSSSSITNTAFMRSDTSSKINTISELPEEQLDNSNISTTSATDAATTTAAVKLAEQMSGQLNIQPPTVTTGQIHPSALASPSTILQPTLAPIPQPPPPQPSVAEALLLQQQLQLVQQQQQLAQQYAQLYQQQQQLQASSSIFSTPPSIPVTPSLTTTSSSNLTNTDLLLAQSAAAAAGTTPQPAATMAAAYNPSTMFYSQTANGTPQLIQMMPVQYMNGMQAMMAVPSGSIYAATPTMMPHATTALTTQGTPTTPALPGNAETFEQKWARIQAAKKTNPFAEDIAKKFEIKL